MISHVVVPRPRRSALARPVFADLAAFADFDRLFDELWRGLGTPRVRERAPAFVTPRMDVRETGQAYELHVEMPGLEQKDVEVSIEEGVLTLSGKRPEQKQEESGGARHVETWRGSFRRAVKLPEGIDEEAVTATCKNGMLTVTLPKLPEAKREVRQIPVSTS